MKVQDPKLLDEIFLSKKSAWLYYVARLNQNEIAKKIGLSKMRVHRLIAYAEKNGFVKTFVEGGFDQTFKFLIPFVSISMCVECLWFIIFCAPSRVIKYAAVDPEYLLFLSFVLGQTPSQCKLK